jgi:hypothetical protein
MKDLTSFTVWLHGLAAAFISSFATAASGAIALPTVFTFDKVGFINMAKLATVPALLAVFAYLRQSPVPALSVVTTQVSSVEVKSN